MEKQREIIAKFGERLKFERRKQKLTQQALAEKIGSKQDYIAQLEKGVRNPSLGTVINLLAALDVSADALIFGNADDENDIFKKFNEFLTRKTTEEATAYLDIVKFLSKYLDKN